MAVCLANPGKKPVHKLRSSTRRIEALLGLLAHVPGLPPHKKEDAKLRRELRKLRRAAGAVRDLDVHEDLLGPFLHPRSRTEEGAELRADAEQMRADQERRRIELAEALQKLLKAREADIAGALEALVKALKPAEDLQLNASQVVEAAQFEYCRAVKRLRLGRKLAQMNAEPPAEKHKRKAQPLSEDDLHDVRKHAKRVRYMLESAVQARRASTLAKEYEALQESGGHWHDFVELASESRQVLGRKHPLTAVLKQRRRKHHGTFLSALGCHIDRHGLG